MSAQGYFKGKAATTEPSGCPPVIPGCASEASVLTEPCLLIFVRDDKEIGINEHHGTATAQDLTGRIFKE